MLPYQEINEDTLEEKINLMLNNQKFTTRAKEIGSITVDQLQHPLERATWWLEHIMRHPHKYRNKSPVLKLAWYQYFCLDVILTILVVCFLVLFIVYKVLVILYSCCLQKKKKKE